MKGRGRRYAPLEGPIKSRARIRFGPPDAVPARPRLRVMLRLMAALLVASGLLWWSITSDERAIRELPEAQRLPLLQSTIANLKNVCDPAPPLSMREFCRRQAELAIKFSECTRDPGCQQLAQRHLYQPHR